MAHTDPYQWDEWWEDPPEPDPDDWDTMLADADDWYERGAYTEDGE